MIAALNRLDSLIRHALGRAMYGYPHSEGVLDTERPAAKHSLWCTKDGVIAGLTMVIVFLLIFLVLLVFKLLLGMALLRYSRDRYVKMRAKEHAIASGKLERDTYDARGKRVGGRGQVEIGEDRRRWFYGDDAEGLRKAREKERRAEKGSDKEKDLATVSRYEMIARRIW
jgi:hypothetical protein